IALLIRCQDHRHRLRMDWLDDGVRGRGEKAVDVVRPGYRLRLRAPVALELGPNAREAGQRPIIIDCEPDHIFLLGLRIGLRCVFGEAVGWDQASVLWLEPSSPVW